MLRLALPALCCAALLSHGSGVERRPRALHAVRTSAIDMAWAAPRHAAEERAPATVNEAEPDGMEGGPPPPDEARPPEPGVLRQHDVRDLVAIGFRVEEIARRARDVCKEADVTTRVNAVEMIAPEDAQIGYERLLDEMRRKPYVVRIHPVADLVCTLEEWTALQEELAVELRAGGYDPPGGNPVASEDEPEPCSPFDIEALAEAISAAVTDGVVSIDVSGVSRCLVVLADPAAHIRIGRFLDELRSNVKEERSPR